MPFLESHTTNNWGVSTNHILPHMSVSIKIFFSIVKNANPGDSYNKQTLKSSPQSHIRWSSQQRSSCLRPANRLERRSVSKHQGEKRRDYYTSWKLRTVIGRCEATEHLVSLIKDAHPMCRHTYCLFCYVINISPPVDWTSWITQHTTHKGICPCQHLFEQSATRLFYIVLQSC